MISMRGVGGYVRPAEVGSPDQPGISPPAGEGGGMFRHKNSRRSGAGPPLRTRAPTLSRIPLRETLKFKFFGTFKK